MTCVMCGQKWDEDYDRGNYVTIGDEPVCSGQGSSHGSKCKWEFIEEQFTEYIKKNDVLGKAKALAANPTLDGVIALKRDLSDWGADETGEPADTNLVNSVIGPLYDAEDVMKRGLNEYVPECMKELVDAVEAIVTNTPEFSAKDRAWLKNYKIQGSKE